MRGSDTTKRNEAPITTANSRVRLASRGKPYFRLIQAGLHLGYRKNSNSASVWVARRALGQDRYEFQSVGTADDVGAPADALAFDEAVRAAKVWFREAAVAVASITVREAIEAYATIRESRQAARSPFAAPRRFRSTMARVLSHSLADIEVGRLTRNDLRAWRQDLAAAPTTGKGAVLAISSVRRVTKDLRAALHHAAREHDLAAVAETIKVGLRSDKAEIAVNSRAPQVLSDAEIRSIVEAARAIDADLHRLILVLAACGCRFSQAQRLTVGDVDAGRSRINVPTSHKGSGHKASHTPMPVPGEVIAALAPVTNGRASGDYLLERNSSTGRGPWLADEQGARWQAIIRKAGLGEHIIQYALRHSSIVSWLVGRFPSRFVAVLHDTSSQMIESHYARFITDAFDDQASTWAQGKTFASATVTPLRVA